MKVSSYILFLSAWGSCCCIFNACASNSPATLIPSQSAQRASPKPEGQSSGRFSMVTPSMVAPSSAYVLRLSEDEAFAIGQRIWANECGGTVEGLTSWNPGEEFASLGIGHCLWFPAGYAGAFGESFPRLIDFMRANGGAMVIPDWLNERWEQGERTCPWATRAEFIRAKDSPAVKELRAMLSSTVHLQARFIANRVETSLSAILAVTPAEDTARIKAQFYRVASAPSGLYVLADYINFKGEGIKDHEQYSKRGWGLRHVLQAMSGTGYGKTALIEFATAAKRCLSERVKFAPLERNEERWLEGWHQRVQRYIPEYDK